MEHLLISKILYRASIVFMMMVFLFSATGGIAYEITYSIEPIDKMPMFYIPAPAMPVAFVQEYCGTPEVVYEPESEAVEIVYVSVLQEAIPSARCYFKSWMDWRSITYRNSRQWRMQQIAYTCDYGFRRVDGLYMIALGTYFLYHGVGDVFDVTLSSDITFRAVVGDIKDDRHTDPTNRFHRSDGSVVEFIVDRRVMCRSVLSMGDVSFAGLHGEVVGIRRLPELFVEV